MMSAVSDAVHSPSNDESSAGKYKFIANLGGGGMADVYLAVVEGPARVKKLQVVKRLRRDYLDDPDHVEMFLDEARLAARLNHPNVVQTFEVSENAGEYFMAMEYIDGVPFNRILNRARNKPPPPGVLLRILADTLSALHYAHELTEYDGTPLNVVHRDVSPHNVMVTYDGQTKLLDFGIAKSEARTIETRSGVVKGKISYMSPEQARAKPLDRRADIFVVGILIWEAMAGIKIWEKSTDMEVLHRLAVGDMPDLQEACPNVPEAIVKIVNKAFCANPEGRYATAQKMREDILAYLDRANIKVTNEIIAEYVSTLFADKRAEIKKVIERQLRRVSSKQSTDEPSGILDLSNPLDSLNDPVDLPRLSGSGARSGGGSKSDSHSTSVSSGANASVKSTSSATARPETAHSDSMTEMPGRSRGSFYIAGAIMIAASLGAFVFLRSSARSNQWTQWLVKPSAMATVSTSSAPPTPAVSVAAPDPSALAPEPSALAPEPSAVAPEPSAVVAVSDSAVPVPSAAPSATIPESIELQVTVLPETATVYLDGAKLPSNPFKGRFPRDKIGHRLEATAPDYRPVKQFITFGKDVAVELTLEMRPGTPAYREWIKARQAAIVASANAARAAASAPKPTPPAPQ